MSTQQVVLIMGMLCKIVFYLKLQKVCVRCELGLWPHSTLSTLHVLWGCVRLGVPHPDETY